ncbi:MAG: peptide deformylase [Patescibacteria group bacterium]
MKIMKIPTEYNKGKILPIVKAGNPGLTAPNNAEVSVREATRRWFQKTALNMLKTSYHYEGAGIAAPQVGIDLRMFALTIHPSSRYPQAPDMPDMIILNPRIVGFSNKLSTIVEGCLSIPGFYAAVTRPESITVDFLLFNHKTGETTRVAKRTLNGFAARVFQHEYDHTIGVLFPTRVTDWSYCAVEETKPRLRKLVEKAGHLIFPSHAD